MECKHKTLGHILSVCAQQPTEKCGVATGEHRHPISFSIFSRFPLGQLPHLHFSPEFLKCSDHTLDPGKCNRTVNSANVQGVACSPNTASSTEWAGLSETQRLMLEAGREKLA